jgi:hypothetical protein
VVKKSDVLRLHSLLFLYGYQSGSNACGCGSAALTAAAAAAAKNSRRSSGYANYVVSTIVFVERFIKNWSAFCGRRCFHNHGYFCYTFRCVTYCLKSTPTKYTFGFKGKFKKN